MKPRYPTTGLPAWLFLLTASLPAWGEPRDPVEGPPPGKPASVRYLQGRLAADALTRKGAVRFDDPGGFTSLALSPDGKTLATGGMPIRLWDVASAKELHRLKVGKEAFGPPCLAFSPEGKVLAAGGWWDGSVRLWDVATGKECRRFQGAPVRAIAIAFFPDGKALVSRHVDGLVCFWEVATGKVLQRFQDTGGNLGFVAISPDGALVASGTNGRRVRLWETASGKELSLFGAQQASCGAFSGDGRMVAFATDNQTAVCIFEVRTGKLRRQLTKDQVGIFSLALSPNGRLLVLAEGDGVCVWDVNSGQEWFRVAREGSGLCLAAFSARGSALALSLGNTVLVLPDVTGPDNTGQAKVGQLRSAELDALWADLASDDAAKAYQAILALAAAPREAMSLLREKLRPERADPDALRHLSRWMENLDSDDFAERERATKELARLGRAAEPALRQALTKQPSPEARRRLQLLLERLETLLPDELRALRSVEVLEHVGTPEARELLEGLAKGAPAATLTQDAKGALERLARRVPFQDVVPHK